MIKDAEAHADEAHKLRELADARNQAESLAYQTEKSLKEHRDKLDEADASTIEGRIMELKQRARELATWTRSARRREALQEASHKLAEARLRAGDRQQAQSAPGRRRRRRRPTTRSSRTPTTRSIDEEEEAKTA